MKKQYYFLVFSIFISLSTYGHNYYFSFAEVEYNDFCNCFQVTLSVTTHDFEQLLRKEGLLKKDLGNTMNDEKGKLDVNSIINNSFQLFSENQQQKLKIEHFTNELTGTTNFYLSSESVKISNELTINFPLLMDYFPDQQNKITFIYRGKKSTINFISTHQKQTIKLEE